MLRQQGMTLWITFSRPERRNAMSLAMVDALQDAFAAVAAPNAGVRAVVLRGAGGNFGAGGDVSDMAGAADEAAAAAVNRRFGVLLQQVSRCPAAVVALCEGAVLGGGFGLACVADVTIAVEGAQFRLPETGLGITPAQIAPFLVQRLGLSHARRLAVTGQALSAAEAVRLSLAHHHAPSPTAGEVLVAETLRAVRRSEPGALAATKALMLDAWAEGPTDALLDRAAQDFAVRARHPTAQAGFLAFLQKRLPPWAEEPQEEEKDDHGAV